MLERISWINDIIVSCTSCVKEQIQEILSDDLINNSAKIKYICPTQKHENGTSTTANRLLKLSLNYLSRGEQNDVIIVHDIKLPYLEEELLACLVTETLKNGVTCLATSELIDQSLLFKMDEANIQEAENGTSLTQLTTPFSSVFVDDYLDSRDYKIGHKPQCFQYSIFDLVFKNVT